MKSPPSPGRLASMVPERAHYPLRLLWRAGASWLGNSGPQLGASIAFYTMFALAPWLVITIAIAAPILGEEAARGQIFGQIEGLVGAQAASAVQAMIESAWREPGGLAAGLLGAATLLAGASGVFVELRRAINEIGGAEPQRGTVGAFVRVRLTAFALLLGFGFLAIASLLLSAVIAALGHYAGTRWPALRLFAWLFDLAFSTTLLAMAFAGLLRWLPDRPLRRRALWIAAVVSAALFTLGKNLIGLYLGRAGIGSSYGAAGSFVVLMLWVYYSSQLMLFGAACGYADESLRTRTPAAAAAATKSTSIQDTNTALREPPG